MYKIEPIKTIGEIPVFTEVDTEYIKNYDCIAREHLQALALNGENPYGNKKYTEFITRNYIKYINKYIKPSDYVLDAGVGIGDIIYNLSTPHKYGVDISLDYLVSAKSKGVDVCLAMLEDLPYEDEIFDAVMCRDVFEHVFDLFGCVKNILLCLKKGAYLIFQVPHKQDLTIYLNYTKHKYVHLRNFDEASLILMFQKIFNCKCIEYYVSVCDFETNCNTIDMVIQK